MTIEEEIEKIKEDLARILTSLYGENDISTNS